MDTTDKSALMLSVARVLVVEDEYFSRKVIRTLLLAIGVTDVHEAPNGFHGLEAIASVRPDVVLLDWEMPGLDGAAFVRRVRSPNTFSHPDVPIIMLTAHAERSRVIEAVRLGAHEYLAKPVSSQALRSRLVSVLMNPRPIVRMGDYYGPEPRKMLRGGQPTSAEPDSSIIFLA